MSALQDRNDLSPPSGVSGEEAPPSVSTPTCARQTTVCGRVCATEQWLQAVLTHLPRPTPWPPAPDQGKYSLGLLIVVVDTDR